MYNNKRKLIRLYTKHIKVFILEVFTDKKAYFRAYANY